MERNAQKTDLERRQIPPILEKLLALDVEWTKRFVSFSLNFVPIRSLKTHCKFLEVSHFDVSYIVISIEKTNIECFNYISSTRAMDWFGCHRCWRYVG